MAPKPNDNVATRPESSAGFQNNCHQELFHILESITDAFFALDNDLVVTYFNSAAEQFLNRSAADVLGRSLFDAFPEARGSIFDIKYREALQHRQPLSFETWFDVPPYRNWYDVRVYPRKDGIAVFFLVTTERRQAENAVRRSQAMLARTESIAHVGSWEWDVATDTVTWSDELFRIFKRNPALGAPSFADHPQLYHPEDMQRLRVAVGAAVAHGTAYELELRALCSDGMVRICACRGYAEMGPVGKAERLYGSLQDITERKQIEKALQWSEEIHRATLNAIGDAVIATSPDGRVTMMNPVAEQLTGWPLIDARGRPLEEVFCIFNARTRQPLENPVSKVISLERVIGLANHTLLIARDGREYQIADSAAPIRDDNGAILGVVLVFRDVTTKYALAEAHRFHSRVLNHIQDRITVTDLEGYITYVNDAECDMLGRPREAILGQHVSIYGEDPAAGATQSEIIEKTLQHGEWRGEVVNYHRDGQPIILDARTHLITNDEGQPIAMCGISTDITEYRRAAAEREKLQAQLLQAQKMESVGTLAGGIAHDFNNLLQAMGGFTQLLLLNKADEDPDRPRLMAIEKAVERASRLVHQLLLFSRKAGANKHPLNLNQAVQEAIRILERTIPKMISIEQHLEVALWTVEADLTQVEQVLLNLGSNAASAMPEGGRLTFETLNMMLDEDFAATHAGAVPGRYVLLRVSDTGCGMAPSILPHIFDPFFTTKDIGKGTGLGLASVYGIVKDHGGYISCYSEINQGTTLNIFWPALASETDPKDMQSADVCLTGGAETILVVDDDADIRESTAAALKQFGYTVHLASSGEEALQLLRGAAEIIDLVILDIGMPGMGGHRCLRELLALQPLLKVLIATGYAPAGKVKETLNAGAAGYLSKPYQLKKLLSQVREVLDV